MTKGQTYYYGIASYDEDDFGTYTATLSYVCDHENTIEVAATPSNCTETGYTTGIYCNDCKQFISGHEIIPLKHIDEDNDNLCDICRTIIDEDLFLAVLKTAAIAEINNAKTEASAIIVDKAIADINAATTVDAVNSIKTKALNDMAKADETAAAKALAEAKATAIAEINNAKTETNATIAEKAIADINAATTIEAVNLIKTTALSDMADNPTDPDDPSKACNHMCHKGGFMGFIWKIARFFCKLFGTNKVCKCGDTHY